MSRHLAELAAALAEPSAPSTVRDVWADHIEDSLAGLAAVGTPGSLADLGSGNGVPGLVLADALPETQVICVEAARKRADWITSTAVRCGLENVSVVWSRAEAWDGVVDVVVARALAALPVLCEYAAPLLAVGGRAVFWKGAVPADEEADARHAAAVLGLSAPAAESVPGTERRSLWVFEKLAETPPAYPRRPGIAVKRPLFAPKERTDRSD